MKVEAAAVKGIGKRFGATIALSDVSIEFRPGTIHALMGANGSGKSTLSKILAGVLTADDGMVFSGAGAGRQAIAAVFQETSLIPDMSVQDNIWLGHEPKTAFGVDAKALHRETCRLLELLRDVAPTIRPETPARLLGPAERQLVELLKAVSRNPGTIILDEATASLDALQARLVADLARRWRDEGRIVILITHRMPEVFALADRLSVLHNGILISTMSCSETTESEIVDMMVGAKARKIEREHKARAPSPNQNGGLSLTVDLATPSQPFELVVSRGEIVGLAGLQGQGQSVVLHRLFEGGSGVKNIRIGGRAVTITSPRDAVRAGLALVPGDRNRDGLFRGLSITENIMSASWREFRTAGFIDLGRGDDLTI